MQDAEQRIFYPFAQDRKSKKASTYPNQVFLHKLSLWSTQLKYRKEHSKFCLTIVASEIPSYRAHNVFRQLLCNLRRPPSTFSTELFFQPLFDSSCCRLVCHNVPPMLHREDKRKERGKKESVNEKKGCQKECEKWCLFIGKRSSDLDLKSSRVFFSFHNRVPVLRVAFRFDALPMRTFWFHTHARLEASLFMVLFPFLLVLELKLRAWYLDILANR